MKSDIVQLVFALLVLAFGGALEELLPHFVGVGFPILLMSALFVAPRRRAIPAILFAIAAGLEFWQDIIKAMFDINAWYWDILWGGFILMGALVSALGISLIIKRGQNR